MCVVCQRALCCLFLLGVREEEVEVMLWLTRLKCCRVYFCECMGGVCGLCLCLTLSSQHTGRQLRAV